MATIAVLGTLDSKGEEHAFVAGLIAARGHRPLLIDVGTGGPATVVPDVTREQVASGEVPIYGHELLLDALVHQRSVVGEAVGQRSLYTFGGFLPLGPEGLVNEGIGPRVEAVLVLLGVRARQHRPLFRRARALHRRCARAAACDGELRR